MRRALVVAIAVAVVGCGVGVAVLVRPRSHAPTPTAVVEAVIAKRGSAAETERTSTLAVEGFAPPGTKHVESETTAEGARVRFVLGPGADPGAARRSVFEQLVHLSPGARVPLEPAAGTLHLVITPRDAAASPNTRALVDWRVQSKLGTVAGVARVETCGGSELRVEVGVDDARLRAYGLDLADLAAGLGRGDQPRGMALAAILGGGEYLRVEDVGRAVLPSAASAGIRVADVATIAYASTSPTCTVRHDGQGNAIVSTIAVVANADPIEVGGRIASILPLLERDLPLHFEPLDFEGDRAAADRARSHFLTVRTPSPEGAADELTKTVAALPGIRSVHALHDASGAADALTMLVGLTSESRAAARAEEIATALAKSGARFDITSPAEELPTATALVRVRVLGPELGELGRIGAALAESLRKTTGTVGVSLVGATLQSRLATTVDPERAAALGVSVDAVQSILDLARPGIPVALFRDGEMRFDVVLLGGAEERGMPRELSIRTKAGLAPLSAMTTTRTEPSPEIVLRADGSRYVEVRFSMTRGGALADVRKALAAPALPAGYQAVLLAR